MENRNELHDIRNEVGQYFDHAFDRNKEEEFLQRVNANPAYHRVFTKEKNIRENIIKHVRRAGPGPELIKTIKDNIRVV